MMTMTTMNEMDDREYSEAQQITLTACHGHLLVELT